MSTTRAVQSNRLAVSLAVGLYLVWVLATYLLEGRIHTFLRPEAMGARLTYALVANVLIGIGGSALVIRFLSRAGTLSTEQAGFRGLGHAAIAVAIGVALGFALYALQGAPSWNPMVLINAYSQVLVGSIAEILVCWAVIGSVSQSLLQDRGRWISLILAAIIASVFFFVSRDVYGTIAFHNFLGILGVIRALEASGNLSALESPILALWIMAVVAVAVLIAAQVLLLNSGAVPTPRRVR
jgi:hypothetical protein